MRHATRCAQEGQQAVQLMVIQATFRYNCPRRNSDAVAHLSFMACLFRQLSATVACLACLLQQHSGTIALLIQSLLGKATFWYNCLHITATGTVAHLSLNRQGREAHDEAVNCAETLPE